MVGRGISKGLYKNTAHCGKLAGWEKVRNKGQIMITWGIKWASTVVRIYRRLSWKIGGT